MRVLLIDDHPPVRAGYRFLLESEALGDELTFEEASSIDQVIAGPLRTQQFELILLDMMLPGVKRVEGLKVVKEAFEDALVVVVSGDEDAELILQCLDAGAAGYIPKSTDNDVTRAAIRFVLAHGTYVPAAVFLGRVPVARAPQPAVVAVPDFTPRELDVLRCLLLGKASKVIARDTTMAEGTVKFHLANIYTKLGVRTRAEAMVQAMRMNLLERVQRRPAADGA
jgi:DNA-binding NarL/FixJ family response regulator